MADVSLDLKCGIDPKLWQANCRIPLYPGIYNRWIVATSETFGGTTLPLFPPAPTPTITTKPTVAEQASAVSQLVCRWFDLIEGAMPLERCVATDITVTPLDQRDVSKGWKPVIDMTDCQAKITISESIQVLYGVEFVYRGTFNDAPWPAWGGLIRGWCPIDAEAAALEIYEGAKLDTRGRSVPALPKPQGIGDYLGLPDLPKIPPVPWGWIALGVGGVVVLTRVIKG